MLLKKRDADRNERYETFPSMKVESEDKGRQGLLSAWIRDLRACLRFFSRVPIAPNDVVTPDMARAWRTAPIAGALVGAIGGAVLSVLLSFGMTPQLAAGLALAALVIATGALHEDGLADVADGFGGGHDRDRKLEIMRDSRIGTFGAASVVLSLLLRWAAISAFATAIGGLAAVVVIAGAGISRWLAVAVPQRLPPARPDGLGATSGAISSDGLVQASVLAVITALVLTGPTLGFGWTVLALVVAGVAFFGMCALARKQIGGYTGDVIGATQQICEIAFLATLTLSLST